VVHTHNPITQEKEAGGSKVQDQPGQNSLGPISKTK
jgi:hypothetical protein